MNENDHERIYQKLRDEIYSRNKDITLLEEREKSCINENFELKREITELKKLIDSKNQQESTHNTVIIICVVIIILLLGLCVYFFSFKR